MAMLPRKQVKRKSHFPKPPKVWSKTKTGFNYQNHIWRKVSKRFRIDNPLCAKCQENGLTRPSEVVDHIKPINQGGDPWNPANFQALCVECHNKKSRSERGGNK